MYIDIKNKEEINAALLLTSMSYHEDINKVSETKVNPNENHHRTIVPHDLHQIQPRATQVWNCDEIRLETNGKWRKGVCNYKYFQGEIMWKVQTGYCAPFWCTLLVFNQADRKCSMPLMVAHQARITPKISIATSHWTGQSIKHHLATWMETGGLRP